MFSFIVFILTYARCCFLLISGFSLRIRKIDKSSLQRINSPLMLLVMINYSTRNGIENTHYVLNIMCGRFIDPSIHVELHVLFLQLHLFYFHFLLPYYRLEVIHLSLGLKCYSNVCSHNKTSKTNWWIFKLFAILLYLSFLGMFTSTPIKIILFRI